MKPSLNSTPILLFVLITLVITSCKKNNEKPVTYPLNFYAERIEIVSETRMFTQDGEIKDAQKIAEFTASMDDYFKAENNIDNKGELYVTFLSKEKAIFEGNNYEFEVSQNGDQHLFTSELKTIIPPKVNDSFIDYILKYQSVVTDGTGSGLTLREMKVGYGNYQEIRFPVLVYATTQGIEGQFIHKTKMITNNEFNESVISQLRANETLAVKTYMVICKAK